MTDTMRHAYELPNRMDVPGDHPSFGGDPILRSHVGPTRKVYALGGLHYIRGNSAPYFSLTMASWEKAKSGRWVEDAFGCAHDERWPELAPLAALHLSDCFGAPMYAEGNGFYWLAGYGGGLGQHYHGGNSQPAKSRDECLQVWANHVRLPLDEARAIADRLIAQGEADAKAAGYETAPGVIHVNAVIGQRVKLAHAAWIETQRERWQAEADECCRTLGLRYYYGDRWNRTAEKEGQ